MPASWPWVHRPRLVHSWSTRATEALVHHAGVSRDPAMDRSDAPTRSPGRYAVSAATWPTLPERQTSGVPCKNPRYCAEGCLAGSRRLQPVSIYQLFQNGRFHSIAQCRPTCAPVFIGESWPRTPHCDGRRWKMHRDLNRAWWTLLSKQHHVGIRAVHKKVCGSTGWLLQPSGPPAHSLEDLVGWFFHLEEKTWMGSRDLIRLLGYWWDNRGFERPRG
jgi:hypothetical protein